MSVRSRILLSAFSIFIAGCSGLSLTPPSTSPVVAAARASMGWEPSVKFQEKQLRGGEGECDVEACATIKISYPEITNSPSEEATRSLQDKIYSFTRNPILEDGTPKSEEDVIRDFIGAFRAILVEEPELKLAGSARWTVERTATIRYQSPELACVELAEELYTGGAHGNSSKKFVIIDLRSGNEVTLSEIVEPTRLAAFTTYVESKFRELKGIRPDTSLEQAGFTFPNGNFALPENIGLLPKGLVFHYDEYEIAPFAAGPTELVLTYPELEQFLSPKFSGLFDQQYPEVLSEEPAAGATR